MPMKGLLPVPLLLALLRCTRERPAEPDDEDLLFDEYGAVGRTQVIAKALTVLCPDSMDPRYEVSGSVSARAVKTLDAVLVDMLRVHKQQRDERSMSRRAA